MLSLQNKNRSKQTNIKKSRKVPVSLKITMEWEQQSLSAAGGVLMTAPLKEQDLRSPTTFYLVSLSLTSGLLMGEGKEASPLLMG